MRVRLQKLIESAPEQVAVNATDGPSHRAQEGTPDMSIKGISVMTTVLVALLGCATNLSAEPKSLEAMIPWEGEGRVFRIGPDTMLFLGAFEGIMYVETSEGAMHEGFVMCPVMQKLNLQNQSATAQGHCMITASGGDTVYAELTCAGAIGQCRGTFTLTGGTGRFEGITGSSELVVRSPLQALVADMSDGRVMRVASGLAQLTDLNYEIPAQD